MARKYGKKAAQKVERTMREWKRGELRTRAGKKVTSRKQAIAIGLAQARRRGYKVPPRAHATRKSPAQLDKEIAEYLTKPKLGDPTWEREWSELLTEKHSKARMPTVDELARALRYIENEYVIKDGRVDMEQWAEGLAFGRYAGDAEDKRRAKEVQDQVSTATWLRVAERANYLAREQDEAPRYVK